MKTILINIPTLHSEVDFETISKHNVRASFGDYDGFGINKKAAFDDLVNNMPCGEEFKDLKFPNGFADWYETHYLICVHIHSTEDVKGSKAYHRLKTQGMGGLWELSQELTDEFELLHQGRIWDGEWMEELENWLEAKDSQP